MARQTRPPSCWRGARQWPRQVRQAVRGLAAARRRARPLPPRPPATLAEEEAAAATRLRLVVAHLLAGDLWRPATRGMLYELAARDQEAHPADWEQRLTAAYLEARDGLAPADIPTSAAEERAMIERLRQHLAEPGVAGGSGRAAGHAGA
ncbi:MAG TPA: hypothetical protein VFE37_29735 [Chloroflexota bacterium]|nr:hypothetical protein [Chloroflexota bacterium]